MTIVNYIVRLSRKTDTPPVIPNLFQDPNKMLKQFKHDNGTLLTFTQHLHYFYTMFTQCLYNVYTTFTLFLHVIHSHNSHHLHIYSYHSYYTFIFSKSTAFSIITPNRPSRLLTRPLNKIIRLICKIVFNFI